MEPHWEPSYLFSEILSTCATQIFIITHKLLFVYGPHMPVTSSTVKMPASSSKKKPLSVGDSLQHV